ncbi:hypothetical protein M6D81_16995 [Paenibacillus sp. J5C_2022]|uniref:hypothetical protein n=1 Tax=Paenibacillus sp. J5C2022 TaxID=2977129 RepID=UPI0021D217A1|nr:hypothetical protein [Paenibacillus sp. J5C2022]MCU6710394.1 hypothetical protein [Paenibacillus sp. J5C2022]
MSIYTNREKKNTYVYQLEVMIEDDSHTAALEQLIRRMNGSGFLDYKITSGIQLGQLIEERKSDASSTIPIPIEPQSGEVSQQGDQSHAPADPAVHDTFHSFRKVMSNNTLIRLIVNRGLGIKMSIPCRIININENEQLLTIYHVDEKQVYTFRMNEIEDFQE